jgi:uncharacterized protein YjbI with pentapeptide repeats
MADSGPTALDLEQPVNPYSLLEAVNDGSDTVNTGWLIFLAVMTYLVVTVAGISHKELLLASDIPLPILQVKIGLTSFFLFAPILLLLFHLGVVGQLVLLARKTIEFDSALQLLEPTERRSHPLRLELHNFFFVQGIAGPERSPMMSSLLHGMSWLTVVVLPVVLLLYVQVAFLPYHDVTITNIHRLVVLADIVVLIFIGTFMTRIETSLPVALARAVRQHPMTTGTTTVLLILVSVFSLFVATIPGERLDRITSFVFGGARSAAANRQSVPIQGFVLPFVKASVDGSLFGLFYRNLNVTDLDLVIDKDVNPGEASLNLRGRDLRFAKLDRTDLHQADFTGANMEGASFVGADLRAVTMHCGDIDILLLTNNRTAARCTSARGADFSRARMSNARVSGIDLTGAKLEDVRLENADMSFALMQGADFANANLEGADMTGGVELQGASFLVASMQGVDLTGAKLSGANFSSAALQGAILNHAHLEGAALRDADLEGVDLQLAWLQGADFTGARIAATDFRGAAAWGTFPPLPDTSGLSDLSQLSLRPLDEADVQTLKAMVAAIEIPSLMSRLGDSLRPVFETQDLAAWGSSIDVQKWKNSQAASESQTRSEAFKARLTDGLIKLMCRTRWASGAVATGLVKRARAASFRGDPATMSDRLKSTECAASANVNKRALRELSEIADSSRGL